MAVQLAPKAVQLTPNGDVREVSLVEPVMMAADRVARVTQHIDDKQVLVHAQRSRYVSRIAWTLAQYDLPISGRYFVETRFVLIALVNPETGDHRFVEQRGPAAV
jgi:hypothetical protein